MKGKAHQTAQWRQLPVLKMGMWYVKLSPLEYGTLPESGEGEGVLGRRERTVAYFTWGNVFAERTGCYMEDFCFNTKKSHQSHEKMCFMQIETAKQSHHVGISGTVM